MSNAPASLQELQEIVRDAAQSKQPLEPVGGGTQLHIGYAPSSPLTPVSLRAFDKLIEYAPQDLVVVAQAGMTIAALQTALAGHGQTLPLEIAHPEHQTLGGIVASRANSLTRASTGSVRDWLIGCNAVGGDGQLIVGGGKVVKNVAGYDLPKLYCGSWGTLGIITQVAFKIAPLPQASHTLLVSLSAERNSEEALDSLARTLTPSFTYLLNADAARAVLGEDAPPAQFIALGFDGLPKAVAALSAYAKDAATPHAFQILDLPGAVGAKLRGMIRDLPLQDAPLTVRCNILPSQVGAFARMLEWTARRAGFSAQTLADAGAGIVWAHIFPRDDSEDEDSLTARWMRLYPDLSDKTQRVGGSTVIERMPDCWREAGYPVWSPVLADVQWMRKLKAALDPHGIFRPGRFVNGI